jgi:hypothetical protein
MKIPYDAIHMLWETSPPVNEKVIEQLHDRRAYFVKPGNWKLWALRVNTSHETVDALTSWPEPLEVSSPQKVEQTASCSSRDVCTVVVFDLVRIHLRAPGVIATIRPNGDLNGLQQKNRLLLGTWNNESDHGR